MVLSVVMEGGILAANTVSCVTGSTQAALWSASALPADVVRTSCDKNLWLLEPVLFLKGSTECSTFPLPPRFFGN